MTGLDTHVLARFLTEDDPALARRAMALIDAVIAGGRRCFISPLVMCELSWVLRNVYEVSKADLLDTFDRLLATTHFVIGGKDAVRRALDAYREGPADFADYVIGELNRDEDCTRTVTFNRRLRGHAHFQQL